MVAACLGLAALPPRARDRIRGVLLDLESRVPLGPPATRDMAPATDRERALEAKLALAKADNAVLERALEEAHAVEAVAAAWPGVRRVTAEVVPLAGPEGLRRRIALGRGTRDGVEAGAPVLAGPALVGVVLQATRDRAEAILETDPAFRLRVTASRASVDGILAGNGTGLLTFLPATSGDDDPASALKPGDVLTASRASSLCALPAIVGTVREVVRSPGEGFAHAIVEPAVLASRLDRVVVLEKAEDAPALVRDTARRTVEVPR